MAVGHEVEITVARVLADPDDAAGDDRANLEGLRARDQLVAFRAGIQPHFRNLLARDLVDDLFAHLRRHVQRRHVDRSGHVEDRAVGFQPFDLGLVRVDGHHGVPLLPERAHGAVAELVAIVRRAEQRRQPWSSIIFGIRDYIGQPSGRGAHPRGGACAPTNSSSRRLPSRRFSIDVGTGQTEEPRRVERLRRA